MTTHPDAQPQPDEPDRPVRGLEWAPEAMQEEEDEELSASEKAHAAARIQTSD